MRKFKRLSVLMFTVILAMNSFAVTAFAATTMGYNAVATTDSENYAKNAPINRVFYVKTGKSSASRTLKFEQRAGKISYYMYRNTTKSCMQNYRIFVWNNDTNTTVGKYYWNWSKKTSVKLPKNGNFMVIVYPSGFNTVKNKYLTTKILKLQPIIYGYSESPHWTVTTDATIKYSESDSIKIARNIVDA